MGRCLIEENTDISCRYRLYFLAEGIQFQTYKVCTYLCEFFLRQKDFTADMLISCSLLHSTQKIGVR